MKFPIIAVAATAAMIASPLCAQTVLKEGLWETSDKTTLEGVQPMPSSSKQACLKGAEASLERLLYPTPEDFAKHGCTFAPGPKQPGIFKATTVCPPSDDLPGVTAEAEISYKPDSYEGLGQLIIKDKAGVTVKGTSVLSGKRIGDCPS